MINITGAGAIPAVGNSNFSFIHLFFLICLPEDQAMGNGSMTNDPICFLNNASLGFLPTLGTKLPVELDWKQDEWMNGKKG